MLHAAGLISSSGPLVPQGENLGYDSARGTLGIQGKIFVPYYFEQGQILIPFEEYIPM